MKSAKEITHAFKKYYAAFYNLETQTAGHLQEDKHSEPRQYIRDLGMPMLPKSAMEILNAPISV